MWLQKYRIHVRKQPDSPSTTSNGTIVVPKWVWWNGTRGGRENLEAMVRKSGLEILQMRSMYRRIRLWALHYITCMESISSHRVPKFSFCFCPIFSLGGNKSLPVLTFSHLHDQSREEGFCFLKQSREEYVWCKVPQWAKGLKRGRKRLHYTLFI